MNTRFVTWTIVAMSLTGVTACGSDSSSIPLAPTRSTAPVAPTPPAPPPSLAVDLTGNYTLTFEVGSGCGEVPEELRIRTYQARIEYDRSYGSADTFAVALSGAAFHSSSPVLINVTGNSVHVDLSDNVIVEEPSPRTYVAISGGDGVASAEPTQLSTISASFTGYFKYCAGTQNQCSIGAMVRGMCRSENSRWTLTRR